MEKLDELLGKYLPEWPDGAEYLRQGVSGAVYDQKDRKVLFIRELAIDAKFNAVVKSEYLAARDRIVAEACTELPKTDRKLWKRAALAAFAGYCARPGMDAECAAEEAMYAADAFMNAMEKHLNSN